MDTQQLKELAQRATAWPWKWFTGNSHNRLSSVPSGKDGDVISAFKAVDGVACVSVSRADMAFIEAAHPGVVIDLIARMETAERANAAQDDHINQQQTRIDWLEAANSGLGKALCAAEAELARRDAAALKPIAVVDIQRGRGDGKKFALCYTSAGHSLPDDVYNLYTAAQPAVLPPVANEREAFNAWNNDDNLPIGGVPAKNASWLAWQARAALGAQPAASVPDGWAMVPVDPTPEMISAAEAVDAGFYCVWKEMIHAAPEPGGDHDA